jgi:hypothetical protein
MPQLCPIEPATTPARSRIAAAPEVRSERVCLQGIGTERVGCCQLGDLLLAVSCVQVCVLPSTMPHGVATPGLAGGRARVAQSASSQPPYCQIAHQPAIAVSFLASLAVDTSSPPIKLDESMPLHHDHAHGRIRRG